MFEKGGEYHVIFTKRSQKVKCHKGEISFPGGTVDRDDTDLLHTALREGAEEIGLASHDVTILGRLDDVLTVTTGFIITTYVGIIPYPYAFRINKDEIAKLIFVPLQVLAKECRVKVSNVPGNGKEVTAYSFYLKDYIIWGATARILKQLMDLLPLTA